MAAASPPIVHSPHHRPYTRRCEACQRRRPWKGGAHVSLAARQVFLCASCKRELVRLRQAHARELKALRERHGRELEAAAARLVQPLFPGRP